MKHSIKLTLSAILCSALFMQSAAALSYTGIGEVTDITRDTVGKGLTYTEYSSASQQTYIFEYDPAGGTLPLVRWGTTVYGKDRVASMGNSAAADGTVVLGALNGDFFSMQTGVPIGVMIDGGRLVSTDDSKYAVGFRADGTALIGKPGMKLTMTNTTRGAAAVTVDHVNKFPTQWASYLLTDDFASTTLSAAESLEINNRLDGEIPVSGSVTGTVVDVVTDDCNTAIPDGCAVLTIAQTNENCARYAGTVSGDKVRFDVSCAEGWEGITTAIGGGDLILNNGTMPLGIIDEEHEKTANPRTAVGIKADGKVVFFAVDGRSASSHGLTETELSAVMAELGCVSALNLDGGGSTTVMVKHSSSPDCVYVNVPSDGSYRSVANSILFVSKTKSDGVMSAISPLPNTPTVLTGSSVSISALPLDSAYMPMGLTIPSENVTLAFAPDTAYGTDAGSIKGGTFTAGTATGEYRLTASAKNGLVDITSDLSIIVTDRLDSLNVTPAVTKVAPGTLVELNIDASLRGNSVTATHESFYYTLNGTHVVPDQKDYPGAALICDIGYLDMNGNFQTFGNREGEVEIGIHYGPLSDTVIIRSGTGSDILANFDDPRQIGNYVVSSAGGIYLASNDFGHNSIGSMEIGISYENALNARVMDIGMRHYTPLPEIAESIKLWISGDISDCMMTASIFDEHGTPYTLSYTVTKDYSRQLGWREITAVIPQSLRTGTMQIASILSLNASGSATRAYTIDDISIYYGTDPAPALTGLEGNMAEKQIHTLYEMGVIQNFDCETTADGKLWWDPNKAVTREEFAKIMSLWMGYNAMAYAENGIMPEAATAYDKIPYIRAVLANNLMNGAGFDENGILIFNSADLISREAVFKVLGSLLNTEETRLLTFTDTAAISDWAIAGIAKCVNAGVITGYDDNTIRPGEPVTRAQLALLLSRMP